MGDDPKFAAASAFAGILFVCVIGIGFDLSGEANAGIGSLIFIGIISGLLWLDMREK